MTRLVTLVGRPRFLVPYACSEPHLARFGTISLTRAYRSKEIHHVCQATELLPDAWLAAHPNMRRKVAS